MTDILEFDRRHLWHPYASAVSPPRTREIVSAEGARLRLAEGGELIDGMASWWCAIHGYNHPRLNRALERQLGDMAHVMFGGLTHAPAVRLAERLLALAPGEFDRVFFADSGSVAVEAAIKTALQYWQSEGAPSRVKILALRGGYHGDTLGAMSVCDPVNGMHRRFAGALPEQIFVERPAARYGAPFEERTLEDLRRTLDARSDEIAAMIYEPIAQGAGGMWFYSPEWLREAARMCRERGVLLVADEIATGFGRTGALFASERAGVSPDILALGKALSGGYMTLAATLTTKEVAETVSRNGAPLMHGPTFMANPLACAVALESVELLRERDWRGEVGRIEAAFRRELAPALEAPGVADVRVLGAIGVIETEAPVNVERLQDFCVERGVWLRPFGKTIYSMPPYIIGEEDLVRLGSTMREAALEEAWR